MGRNVIPMAAMELTLEEAAKLLASEQEQHKLARLVDPEECRELSVTPHACAYGQPCHAVWGSEHRCSNCVSFRSCRTAREAQKRERQGGQIYEITSKPVHIHTADGAVVAATLELIDWREATAEERAAVPEKDNENATFLSTHDALTGLYNKDGFSHAVRAALAGTGAGAYTMISVNLRQFHMINDLYSIERGNAILVTVAQAIRRHLPEGACAGRLFGDHFVVFTPSGDDLDARLELFLRHAPVVTIDGEQLPLHLHAGVYTIEDAGLPVAVMIDRADMARKEIENDYNIPSARYTKKLWETARDRQWMVNHFAEALGRGEFQMYLQPQMNREEKLVAAEALVRWKKADGTIVPPGAFIPCFESSGQVAQLDRYVWELAARQLSAWEGTPFAGIAISVNVSPKDFLYLDVADALTGLVREYRIAQELLRVEITESAVVAKSREVDRIVDAGFHVEIDDFGKGYSSLNTLRSIRAKTLKLDMFFQRVTDETKERGRIIVGHVIHMGKELGMKIVAEGVETEAQKDHLLAAGCDTLQGYLYSPPIPVEAFEEKYGE